MIVKLKNVRIAFCQNLHVAAGFQGSNEGKAFSSTFIIQKDDEQLSEVKQAINSVANAKWPKDAEKILKTLQAKDFLCIHDGNLKADEYEGFEGCFYISARNDVQPIVLGKNREVLTIESGLPYAGCYVNASLDIWAQDNKFGKRINAKLRGVQFAADGTPFASSAPANVDEFDDVSDTGDDSAGMF